MFSSTVRESKASATLQINVRPHFKTLFGVMWIKKLQLSRAFELSLQNYIFQ